MKVYLATAGEYSDYRVLHVFARKEDAEAYPAADEVEERELREGPIEQRTWHMFWWNPSLPDSERHGQFMGNPWSFSDSRDFDGDDPDLVTHQWVKQPTAIVLHIQGWDLERIRKVYSEQRAQHLARQQGVS